MQQWTDTRHVSIKLPTPFISQEDFERAPIGLCVSSLRTAPVLRPRPTLYVLTDEPDNRILECAIAAEAHWIVTGDRHLLALRQHTGSTIISLVDFLAELEK